MAANDSTSPFGALLVVTREARDETAAQFAAYLGVSPPTLRSWTNGRSRPRADRWDDLARRLDVPPGEIEAYFE